MLAISSCLAIARHRCYGTQNEQYPRGAASIHVRATRKRVYGYRGSELARARIGGASMLVRVTGERVRWDKERENEYTRRGDESASIRAYSREKTSVSPA
jgi:hypothetical protein